MRVGCCGGVLPLLLLLAVQLAGGAAAAYVARQTIYLPARFGRPVYGPAPNGYLAVVGPIGWTSHTTVHHSRPPTQANTHSAPHSAAKAPLQPPTQASVLTPSLPPPRTNDTYGAYLLPGGNGYSYASEAGSGKGGHDGSSGKGSSNDGDGLPKLSLDYGVPVTGFLEAQSSYSSGTSVNWSMDMTPANQSLPLIPDDIPVIGE